MFNNYPDILTVEQAAAALGVCKNSIYRLVRERVLGCKRIGRKILIPKVCIQAYARSALHTVKL